MQHKSHTKLSYIPVFDFFNLIPTAYSYTVTLLQLIQNFLV